ncbi:hypothetical protein [Bradyrhizobium japonicum]|uniref:hypothetical protein n=1 Tax=Bradyrhizobium japonicum TaxID=375 RepID=UPI002010A014|nr:hypothetical protein [Bradyrhizobium japonicum]UQD96089.1 hypothetical protein JEY30_31600 [Bradyrhizobium japonicum]
MGSQYRHRRTSDPTSVFPGLEPGEIAVNTSNRQLAVGDANGATIGTPVILLGTRLFDTRAQYAAADLMVRAGIIYRALVDVAPGAFNIAQWEPISGTLNPAYVQKAGDTMAGALVLAGDPANAMEAATKQYADTKLSKAGGTMTGNLVLAGDPSTAAMAATKQYVDAQVAAKAAVYISDTPPAGVPDNSLWWESDTGLLFVRYRDADSVAWVLAMPMPDVSQFVQKAGDIMTGPLTLPGNPTDPLHAAPKQFVDAGDAATLAAASNTVNARAVRYDAAQALTAAQQLQARQNVYAAPLDAMSCQNIMLNGDFQVSQLYGTSAVTIPNNASAYVVDGWSCARNHAAASAVFVAQQGVAGYPVGANYVTLVAQTGLTAPGASDYAMYITPIEGTRWARLWFGTGGAQPITVGFWVYASVVGTGSLAIRNRANNRAIVANFTVSTALTWEWKTVVIPGDTTGTWPTDAGVGAFLSITFCGGATYQIAQGAWTASNAFATPQTTNFFAANGNAVFLSGVVVLPGAHVIDSATAFRLIRPYSDELTLCQRYFMRWGAAQTFFASGTLRSSGSNSYLVLRTPTPMRAAPTLTWNSITIWSGDNNVTPSSIALFGGQDYVNGTFTVGAAHGSVGALGDGILAYTGSSGGFLQLDARL